MKETQSQSHIQWIFHFIKKEQQEYVREITRDRRTAGHHQMVIPTTTFSQSRIGLDVREVSGQMVYELCSLGLPGRFLGGALEVTGQRGRAFTPI